MPLQSGYVLQVVQLLGRDLALDHLEVQADEAVRVLDGAALHKVDHQRSRRLRDGAAAADKPGVLDFAVFYAQLQRDVVTAAGVDTLQAVGRPLDGWRFSLLRLFSVMIWVYSSFRFTGPSPF